MTAPTKARSVGDFYPRPPCGGRPSVSDSCAAFSIFLSTSPLRGTTALGDVLSGEVTISIHVPLAGDDAGSVATAALRQDFYPRPPCGGRRGGYAVQLFGGISIHVPLAGDDSVCSFTFTAFSTISIHVPLAGDDPRTAGRLPALGISIHVPLAGDDSGSPGRPASPGHFYPRPPCGGRPRCRFSSHIDILISIHVPLAGDDKRRCCK